MSEENTRLRKNTLSAEDSAAGDESAGGRNVPPRGRNLPARGSNINADFAASKIAGKLKAEKLILMTNVMGLLEDEHKPETLISVVKTSEVARLKKDGIIKGGMIPKMDC